MPKRIVEQAPLTEAAAAQAKQTGRLMVQFISPGWGSSGYYSPEVVAEAAETQFIPAGTHMYADHPTDAEDAERPGRSIKDLMAVAVEDARLATEDDVASWGADLGALVGPVDVVPAWQPLIETVRDHIGTSIRGSATDIVEGEAEGRRGRIVEGLVAPCTSVDFVTRAGRGGKVLRVLESAQTNHRAIEHGIAEATVNDTREALQTTLRDAYAGDKTYVWVRDFDDSTVWFEVEGDGDDNGIFAQAYADDGASLSGDRTEVRVQTNYVPVNQPASESDLTLLRQRVSHLNQQNEEKDQLLEAANAQVRRLQESLEAAQDVPVTRPDSTNPTTEESQEDTMGKIQIEESEHTRLTEKAGRVDALESENAALKAEKAALEESRAADQRRARAMDLIREHDHAFTPLEAKGLVADLPVVAESSDLDEEAFKTQLAEHAAAAAQAKGAGTVSGFGQTTDTTTQESAPKRTTTAWGRPVAEQKGA